MEYKAKPIIQYSSWGVELKRWPSAHAAAKALGINYGKIIACTNGHKRQYQGFIWRKETEPLENEVKTSSLF